MSKTLLIFLCLFLCVVSFAVDESGGDALIYDSSGNSLNSTSNALNSFITNFPATFGVTQSTSPWVTSATQSGTWTVQQGTPPWSVSQSGAWTVTANAGTNLNTSALALDTSVNGLLISQGSTTSGQKGTLTLGAVTTSAPSYTTAQTSPLSLTTTGALRVDGSGSTQPISGTITANQGGAPWSQNVTQFGGVALSTGTGASGTGIPRVTVSNDSNILATQSGTWNINNISGTISLPSGASTSALQTTGNTSLATIATNTTLLSQGSTTLGQGGELSMGAVTTAAPTYTTAQTNALSLTTAGALRVDGSGVTQPINVSQWGGTSTTIGQKTMASSVPVVIASDQTGLNSFQDKAGSGNITALNGSVVATTNGASTVVFNVLGTWVATLALQGTVDGSTWFSIDGLQATSTTSIFNTGFISANTQLVVGCGGYSQVRLTAIAFTSGTANIAWNASAGQGGSIVNPVNTYDTNITGGINALNGVSANKSSGSSVTVINVTGTWVATLQLQAATADGLSKNIYGFNQTTGQMVTSITAPAVLIVPSGGYTTVSLTATAYTSGTANIAFTSSIGNQLSYSIASPIDGYKATYAAASAPFTAAATATDIFTITGSATKTIRVTRIEITGTQTTGLNQNILLLKRSTADTAGTSAAVTAVPQDTNNPAATATVLSYTANPTLGTLVGNIRADKYLIPAPGTLTGNPPLIWTFGDRPEQALLLRGTAQVLAVNLNGATLAGNSFTISVSWTEE